MAVDAFSLLPYGHHLIINQNELVVAKPISCASVKLKAKTIHTFSGWMAAQVSYLDPLLFQCFLDSFLQRIKEA